MKATLFALVALDFICILAPRCSAETVEVVGANTNSECTGFDSEIAGRWTVDRTATGWTVGKSGMSWAMQRAKSGRWEASTVWTPYGARAVLLVALVGENPARLTLSAERWGCRWQTP